MTEYNSAQLAIYSRAQNHIWFGPLTLALSLTNRESERGSWTAIGAPRLMREKKTKNNLKWKRGKEREREVRFLSHSQVRIEECLRPFQVVSVSVGVPVNTLGCLTSNHCLPILPIVSHALINFVFVSRVFSSFLKFNSCRIIKRDKLRKNDKKHSKPSRVKNKQIIITGALKSQFNFNCTLLNEFRRKLFADFFVTSKSQYCGHYWILFEM